MSQALGQSAGFRIRSARMDRNMRQADLAKAVGISPSYLNLIEHGRRRIAGKLLADVADALELDPAHVSHGTSRLVLDQLHHAATATKSDAEIDRIEEMAARYPGWANVIAAQSDRIQTLETRLDALRDRMTSDPALAAALHDVISSVTSIRSTASILTSEERLDADWLRRFHGNIHTDAVKLAETSDALIKFLENPEEDDTHPHPHEEVSQWLSVRDFHFPEIETGESVAKAVSGSGLGKSAKVLLRDYLETYQDVARTLPLGTFGQAASDAHYDPGRLAADFAVPLEVVFRRLATLPRTDGHPDFGLAVCDASGSLGITKPVSGFVLPRGGIACAYWPLFLALGQPGRPMREVVEMPGTPPQRLLCYAHATQTASGFDKPSVVRSMMLVRPDAPDTTGTVLPIGSHCRICPRETCAARREPRAFVAAQRKF